MSYILDALRKSDQMRRRGTAPTLLLSQEPAVEPKRSPPLAYGLIALVLLAAGIAIGWMRPWQSRPAANVSPLSAARSPAGSQKHALTPAREEAAKPRPEMQAQYSPPARKPGPVHAHTVTPAKLQETAVVRGTKKSASSKEAASKSLSKPATRVAIPHAAPAPPAPISTMAELPLAIQQEMPRLQISVHAYSANPADRLVDINGHLLHEGDTVAPGMKLETITPEGMILSYKGYTFIRGVR